MLDLCKLVFSHAEIMQMSKEIIVLKEKDILNELKIQIFMIKKMRFDRWDIAISHS